MVIEDEWTTFCVPINCSWTVKSFSLGNGDLEDIDLAWAKIDLNAFKDIVQKEAKLKDKNFVFNIYNGPIDDEPDSSFPHSYVSQNQATIIDVGGKKLLERDISCEVEMFYTGRKNDKGLYIFSITKHKGHDYYRGASGSPVVDPSGKTVSVLLGGCESKNELYGLPLAEFASLILISKNAEQV